MPPSCVAGKFHQYALTSSAKVVDENVQLYVCQMPDLLELPAVREHSLCEMPLCQFLIAFHPTSNLLPHV